MRLRQPVSANAWRWIRAGFIVTLVAATAAVMAGYRVTSTGLQPRNVEFATAKAQILVDSRPSMLVDSDSDWIGSTKLALTYTLFLKTDAARASVGAAVGVPADEVASSGPFTTLLDRTNLVVRVPQPPSPEKRLYRLVIDVAPDRPVVTLYGQAPTAPQAAAIVGAARTLLLHSVNEQQKAFTVPEANKAVLRPLGGTEAGMVNAGARTSSWPSSSSWCWGSGCSPSAGSGAGASWRSSRASGHRARPSTTSRTSAQAPTTGPTPRASCRGCSPGSW